MQKKYFFCCALVIGLLTTLPHSSQASDCAAVEKSFQTFCRVWLDSSQKFNNENLRWQQIDGAFQTEFIRCSPDYQYYIKKTDSPAAPYIGVLKYRELNCVASAPCLTRTSNKSVHIVSECPVTEIFMFKNGRWQY